MNPEIGHCPAGIRPDTAATVVYISLARPPIRPTHEPARIGPSTILLSIGMIPSLAPIGSEKP